MKNAATIPMTIRDSLGQEVTLRRAKGEAECSVLERYYGESSQVFYKGEADGEMLFRVLTYNDKWPYRSHTQVLSGRWSKETD